MNKEQIIQIAAEAGAKAALEAWEKQKQKEVKDRRDRRLWNTRLLLKNYQLLKDHCENAVCSQSQVPESESAIDILNSVDGLDKDTYIESIKRSVSRTKTIIAHIDKMMELYKVYCDTSHKAEEPRRYRVIIAAYLEKPKPTIQAICQREGIDLRTYYRDNRDASITLGALFFGIDGLSSVRKR